ncbi:MAG: hypothetical protein PUI31_05105, partial [Clostridia bacterium]|nr:hypothetical protein [Clostridia bacterium]
MKTKKIKNIFLCLLCVICAGVFAASIATLNVENARAEGVATATAENVKEYTVGSVSVYHLSTNGKVFVLFFDGEGNGCDLGYTTWVVPDTYTTKFEEYLMINGKKMSEVDGVTIQGMDMSNALCIDGFYLSDGGKIV